MSTISSRPLTYIPINCVFVLTLITLSSAFSPVGKTFINAHSKFEARQESHLSLTEDDVNSSYFDSSGSDDGKPSSQLSPTNYLSLEAFSLEQPKENPVRQRRLREESETRRRFVYGNELLELRLQIKQMKEEMQKLQKAGMKDKLAKLREEVKLLLVKDAEFMYGQAFALTEQARLDKREDAAKKYYEEGLRIRACLPHFNIEGLWVGK